MSHVEPQCDEGHDVACQEDTVGESLLQEVGTGGRRNGYGLTVDFHGLGGRSTADFGELHLGPEVHQVKTKEGEDHEAENEHVLRSPFNLRRTRGYVVTFVTAGGAVLQGQPDGVNDVENDNSTEH